MRRFENHAHDEFWEVWIEDGRVLCHRFGRLGTRGLVGIERFRTDDDATSELLRRLKDRLAGGFVEANLAWLPGFAEDLETTEEVAPPPAPVGTVAAAVQALAALRASAGRRSWQVARAGRSARRALRHLGGVDPASVPALGTALDAVMGAAGAGMRRRLSVAVVRDVLAALEPGSAARLSGQLGGGTRPSRGSSGIPLAEAR